MRGIYVAALVAIQTFAAFHVAEGGSKAAGRLVSGVERILGDRTDSDQTLEQIVGNDKDKTYALYFGAKWCGFCQKMKPTIEQLNKDGYIIFMVDGDKNKSLAKEFNVSGYPTVVIMNGGKEVTRFVGLTEKETIVANLKTRKEQEGTVTPIPVPDYPMMRSR